MERIAASNVALNFNEYVDIDTVKLKQCFASPQIKNPAALGDLITGKGLEPSWYFLPFLV